MDTLIKKKEGNRFLPDSSVILSGQLIELMDLNMLYDTLELDEKSPIEFVYSRIVIAELENLANQDKSMGTIGIELLQQLNVKIKELNAQGHSIVTLTYGERPTLEQVKLNSGGELDAAIRQHALETGSKLISADKVQYNLADIEQIPTIFLPQKEVKIPYEKSLDKYFDDTSMSVHLQAGSKPYAKKGKPGKWNLIQIGDKVLTRDEIMDLSANIIKEARADPHSFIEKELKGVTVVQLRTYRIVICTPPFSNTHEITAVKPLVQLSMEDYTLTDRLIDRLAHAEGILVAGRPGAGKSTFISALARFYLEQKKVIKTLESVRDLQVPPEITQYTELEDDFEKTSDILLLVRPDYTIFDEIRTSDDFQIFADMRLAGVGMIGVVHASSALDAIQRFIRRVELGVIPAIVDTVVFIRKGDIQEILKLEMTVKTPHGLRDADLARPVVEVSDYQTNKVLYEIYEFGSNIVVIPVTRSSQRGDNYSHSSQSKSKYKKSYKKKNYASNNPGWNKDADFFNESDLISTESGMLDDDDDDNDYGLVAFRKKDLIEHIGANEQDVIKFYIIYGKKSLILRSGANYSNRYVDVYANEEFVTSVTLNKKGEVRFDKQTHMFHKLDNSLQNGKHIYGVIVRK
ncbi:MAG: Flp pilus assembly complex ATPase component TadA [Candidatus Lokiarchaeota archaeon]|nr:Flp pilus assembly complex ATPase component TadA [Candidatus Lokiarchaeota archaeon]